jgi:hypothetical protein
MKMSYYGTMMDIALEDLREAETRLAGDAYGSLRGPDDLRDLIHSVAGKVAYSIIRGSSWDVETEQGIQAAINESLAAAIQR